NARERRQDPLASQHRKVLAGHRHGTPLLLHAERDRHGLARPTQPANPREAPGEAAPRREEVSEAGGGDGAKGVSGADRSSPPARQSRARRTTRGAIAREHRAPRASRNRARAAGLPPHGRTPRPPR